MSRIEKGDTVIAKTQLLTVTDVKPPLAFVKSEDGMGFQYDLDDLMKVEVEE